MAIPAADKTTNEAVRFERTVTVVTVGVPVLSVAIAAYLLWNKAVTAADLWLCGIMYVVTMLGITMGFHRLFTHRSFQCVPALRGFLGVAGSMAGQGPIFFWAA